MMVWKTGMCSGGECVVRGMRGVGGVCMCLVRGCVGGEGGS